METGLLGSFRAEEEQFIAVDNMHSSFLDDDLMSMDSRIVMFPTRESDGGGFKNSIMDWPKEVLDECFDGALVNERLINLGFDMLEKNSYEPLEFSRSDFNSDDKYSMLNCPSGAGVDCVDKDNILSSSDIANLESDFNSLISYSNSTLDDSAVANLLESIEIENFDSTLEAINNYENFAVKKSANSDRLQNSPKSMQASQIQKKYTLNSARTKRKRPKSFSVPQSPEHDPIKLDICDLPGSLCFEDLSEVDFNHFVDDDININPEKAFNKAFCISDVIDDVTVFENTDSDLNINFDFPSYISEDVPNDRSENITSSPKPSNLVNTYKISEEIDDKSDSDDYIDVENVSDTESSPAIAASNVKSLLKQFEATEKLCKSSKTLGTNRSTASKVKDSNKTSTNSSTSKTHSENAQNRKVVIKESLVKTSTLSTKIVKIKSPSLQIDQESISLDHDYCFASPIKKNSGKQFSPEHEGSYNSSGNPPTTSQSKKMITLTSAKNETQSLLKPIEQNKFSVEKKIKIHKNSSILGYDHSYSRGIVTKRAETKKLSGRKDSNKVQNIIVFENGTERLIDINNDCTDLFIQNQHTHDSKTNNNSLLISNLNKPCSESLKVDFRKRNVPNRKTNSLLKPAANENVKMISLLKSNYCADTQNTVNISSEKDNATNENISTNAPSQPVLKKKLNLQEYKIRKHINFTVCNQLKKPGTENREICHKPLKVEKKNCIDRVSHPMNQIGNITKLVDNSDCKLFDPITEATRKALRLKKSLAQKNDENIVMRRIARVPDSMIQPIIVEQNPQCPSKAEDNNVNVSNNKNSDYEEIVMVSIGVNTNEYSVATKNRNSKSVEVCHGEDRVIMHLLKDRKKPSTQSIALQTHKIISSDISLKNKVSKEISNQSTKPKVQNRVESPVHFADIDKLEQSYMDLINRWKSDSTKQTQRSSSTCRSETSICSTSSRKSHSGSRFSKYKYRRHRGSESPSSKHKRARSYSRDRREHSERRSTKENLYKSAYTTTSCIKRKRNPSTSSNDLIYNGNNKTRFNQPPNKISRDVDNTVLSNLYNDQVSSIKDGVLLNDELKIPLRTVRSRSNSESSTSSSDSDSSASSRCSRSSSSSSSSCSSRSSIARNRSNNISPTSSMRQSRKTRGEVQEERKVIYVGLLEPDITLEELKTKFSKYGYVKTVTFHTKDDGMRYGFVTFAEAQQTYKVLEKASSDPEISHYDVFFGGRREFCKQTYADLDDIEAMHEESEYYPAIVTRSIVPRAENSFDRLLKETRAALDAKNSKKNRV